MREVRAVVAGNIVIHGLTLKAIERLDQTLSFVNPKFAMLEAFRRYTGNEPEFIRTLVDRPDGSVSVPRGAHLVVQRALERDGIRLRYEDCRSHGEPLGEFAEVGLRPYQGQGVQALQNSTQGTIVLGCGGGKTRLGIAAIGKINRSTLVLVHTQDLLDQWVEGVRDLLGLEAGIVAGGQAVWRPVTVAIIDTLMLRLESDADELNRFGFVIVDEAHHAPSKTYQELFPHLPARFRLGLTATPEREDKLTRLMDWSFGDRLLEMRASDLIEAGYLMRPSLDVVRTDFNFDVNRIAMTMRNAKLTEAIVSDEARNTIICDLAEADYKTGESVVILSNHRAHCTLLGEMLQARGVDAHVLIASGSKKAKQARQDAIQGMRDGVVRCIIATSLFDEGVNVDRLSRLILALPQKAKGSTEQKVGRLMRLFDGKQPKLYDLVDHRVSTLVRRWNERKRVYQTLGIL